MSFNTELTRRLGIEGTMDPFALPPVLDLLTFPQSPSFKVVCNGWATPKWLPQSPMLVVWDL